MEDTTLTATKHRPRTPRLTFFSLGLALSFLTPLRLAAANPDATMTIHAEAARPLAAAADEIQRRFGLVVTYEDPIYVYKGDLIPSPHPAAKTKAGIKEEPSKRVIPAGTKFEVNLIPTETNPLLTPMDVLTSTLQQHAATSQPGLFRIEQDGEIFHLIPDQVKNAKGQWSQATPILDTVLTLPAIPRSGAETLRLICDEVGALTGQQILLGRTPINLFLQVEVTLGGTSVPARDLLSELVRSLAHPVSWSLAYEPNLQAFLMNMTVVPARTLGFTPVKPPAKVALSPGGKG